MSTEQEIVTARVQAGDIVEGRITEVRDHGVIVNIGPLTNTMALLHVSHVSSLKVPRHLGTMFAIGDKIKVSHT